MSEIIANEQDIQETREKIDEALPIKTLIETTLKTKLNINKKDFLEILFKAFPEFNDKECLEYKEIKAINKNIIECIVENDVMKDLPEMRTKLESLIIKLKWLLLIAEYINVDFIESLMNKHGLKVQFDSLSKNANLNDDIRQILKENIEESVNITKEINSKQNNEIEQIYNTLSTSIKFDKESNPQGLKSNSFNNLIKLEILKRTSPQKANEKFENLEKNINNKAMSDLFTKTIASYIVEK